jgi:hypothetical protein
MTAARQRASCQCQWHRCVRIVFTTKPRRRRRQRRASDTETEFMQWVARASTNAVEVNATLRPHSIGPDDGRAVKAAVKAAVKQDERNHQLPCVAQTGNQRSTVKAPAVSCDQERNPQQPGNQRSTVPSRTDPFAKGAIFSLASLTEKETRVVRKVQKTLVYNLSDV